MIRQLDTQLRRTASPPQHPMIVPLPYADPTRGSKITGAPKVAGSRLLVGKGRLASEEVGGALPADVCPVWVVSYSRVMF